MKNKLGAAFLSLLVSFGLWLYVVTFVSPEWEQTFYDIPVVMDGESVLNDRGLMIVSGKNQTVTLKLEGNRSDLSKLNKTNITLLADLSRITTAGEHKLSYNISYPANAQSGTITPLEQTPQLITVVVAELEQKDIPVEIGYAGAVPEGYIADKSNIKLDHTTVTVSGPKDLVSQIDHAKVNVDLTGKTATISGAYRFSLCDQDGNVIEANSNISTNLSEITVILKIQKTKVIPLVLNVIYGGGVTEETCQILIDPVSIQIAGSETLLDSIEKITLGTVNLTDILESTVRTYNLQEYLPENVENLTGSDYVEVSISFPDLEIREFKVSDLVALNVPFGMEVNWITTTFTVRLRGATDVLNQLTADRIVVSVDLTGAELGKQGFKPSIRVQTDGVVGYVKYGQDDPLVYLELREAADPGTENQR